MCQLRVPLCALGCVAAVACRPDDVLWSTELAGQGQATAVTLTRSGALVAGGSYEGELSAGALRLQRTELGRPRMFAARLDAADGAVGWLVDLGLDGVGEIEDAAAVGDDVYVVGSFSGEIHSALGTSSSSGRVDAFVARLSANDGQNLETLVLGGTSRQRISSIAVIADGDVLISGDFSGELTIGQKRVTAVAGTDGFVARVSLPGNCLWLETIGGPGDDELRAVALSGSRVAVAGAYADSAMWQGTRVSSVGLSDLFVAVLSVDDGHAIWSSTLGSSGGDLANDVSMTDDGRLWVAGLASGRLSAEPARASDGSGDALLASFSPRGERASLDVFGALGFDEATAVVARPAGAVVVVGGLRGTVAFEGAHATSASDTSDGFVALPGAARLVLVDRQGEERFRAAVVSEGGEIIACGSSSVGPWVTAVRAP
jgi:hypothetical protein